MTQAALAQDPAPSFRSLEVRDIPAIIALGSAFFAESELMEFSTFSPSGLEKTLRLTIENPAFECIVFTVLDIPQGFITFYMEASYTEEPLALGHLLYVSPEYRQSPIGRLLLEVAEGIARDQGCVAFYQGAMAGIDGVSKTLPNMLKKQGYSPLFWGRKIFKETA